MEINLLAVSAGNSRIALGVFVAGELAYSTRFAIEPKADWRGRIKEAWERIAGRENAAVAGASVNPKIQADLEQAVGAAAGNSIAWIGRQIDLPINVLTDSPNETGVDRIVNIAAAFEQMQKACVVVDAGSAITIDCCNDQGEFLGGAIAPGVSMMLKSLSQETALLPRVDPKAPQGAFGKSTAEAIRQGIFHGVRGMVKELAENYATELGVWPDIITTGGDATMLFEGWELIHAIAPDLTLYGIALAYTNHHLKHS